MGLSQTFDSADRAQMRAFLLTDIEVSVLAFSGGGPAMASMIEEATQLLHDAGPRLRGRLTIWIYVDHYAPGVAKAGRLEEAAMLAGFADEAHRRQGVSARQANEARSREELHALLRATYCDDDLGRLLARGAALGEDEASAIALACG
jgi:hypothetical protein